MEAYNVPGPKKYPSHPKSTQSPGTETRTQKVPQHLGTLGTCQILGPLGYVGCQESTRTQVLNTLGMCLVLGPKGTLDTTKTPEPWGTLSTRKVPRPHFGNTLGTCLVLGS